MSAFIASQDGLRPSLHLSTFKDKILLTDTLPPGGGTLSPNVNPPGFFPQLLPCNGDAKTDPSIEVVGSYLLVEKLSSAPTVDVYRALHIGTHEEFVCKAFPVAKYRDILSPYWQCGPHPHIADIVEIIVGASRAYVLFRRSHEDLHSYIRRKRRLREAEAAQLFAQIVSAIKRCHRRGVVLGDLKLRKFVFVDQQRTQLVLEGLEDAFLLDDAADDRLTEKHGCPAYVSPEILSPAPGYSGRAADAWSLGVVLYTMLFGQYPFHDTVAAQLFGKIRRGRYTVPETVSGPARCLVRSLLRTEPSERLSVVEARGHPWLLDVGRSRSGRSPVTSQAPSAAVTAQNSGATTKVPVKELEQKVPEFVEPAMAREEFEL
jgi:tribbles-like protein